MSTHRAGFMRVLNRLVNRLVRPRNSIQSSCTEHFAYEPLFEVLSVVQDKSEILSPKMWPQSSYPALARYVAGLGKIAMRKRSWLRDLQEWNPSKNSPRRQFQSLLHHLFANYPVPNFFTNCWLDDTSSANRDINLLLFLGRGKRLRDAHLDFHWSKPTMVEFYQAPDHLSISQAFRWAQTKAEGGANWLANELATLIPLPGTDYEQEHFWQEAIFSLVRIANDESQPNTCRSELAEIIKFAKAIRFGPPQDLLGHRLDNAVPIAIDFTLQKRSLKWIRRFMAHWKSLLADDLLARTPKSVVILWKRSPFEPFWSGEGEKAWTISELLSSRELKAEGHFMHHCVGGDDYVKACANRKIGIWSLRRISGSKSKRIATIEVVNESSQIVTALGKCNENLHGPPFDVIERWAQQQSLTINLEC